MIQSTLFIGILMVLSEEQLALEGNKSTYKNYKTLITLISFIFTILEAWRIKYKNTQTHIYIYIADSHYLAV